MYTKAPSENLSLDYEKEEKKKAKDESSIRLSSVCVCASVEFAFLEPHAAYISLWLEITISAQNPFMLIGFEPAEYQKERQASTLPSKNID